MKGRILFFVGVGVLLPAAARGAEPVVIEEHLDLGSCPRWLQRDLREIRGRLFQVRDTLAPLLEGLRYGTLHPTDEDLEGYLGLTPPIWAYLSRLSRYRAKLGPRGLTWSCRSALQEFDRGEFAATRSLVENFDLTVELAQSDRFLNRALEGHGSTREARESDRTAAARPPSARHAGRPRREAPPSREELGAEFRARYRSDVAVDVAF